jgi:hypothetical protein
MVDRAHLAARPALAGAVKWGVEAPSRGGDRREQSASGSCPFPEMWVRATRSGGSPGIRLGSRTPSNARSGGDRARKRFLLIRSRPANSSPHRPRRRDAADTVGPVRVVAGLDPARRLHVPRAGTDSAAERGRLVPGLGGGSPCQIDRRFAGPWTGATRSRGMIPTRGSRSSSHGTSSSAGASSAPAPGGPKAGRTWGSSRRPARATTTSARPSSACSRSRRSRSWRPPQPDSVRIGADRT